MLTTYLAFRRTLLPALRIGYHPQLRPQKGCPCMLRDSHRRASLHYIDSLMPLGSHYKPQMRMARAKQSGAEAFSPNVHHNTLSATWLPVESEQGLHHHPPWHGKALMRLIALWCDACTAESHCSLFAHKALEKATYGCSAASVCYFASALKISAWLAMAYMKCSLGGLIQLCTARYLWHTVNGYCIKTLANSQSRDCVESRPPSEAQLQGLWAHRFVRQLSSPSMSMLLLLDDLCIFVNFNALTRNKSDLFLVRGSEAWSLAQLHQQHDANSCWNQKVERRKIYLPCSMGQD